MYSKKILIINNAEPGLTEFTKPLENIIKDSGFETFTIEYAETINFDFSPFSGIIMSGSSQGDDIVKHHLPYFKWIKQCKIPVFGICAGHHITGYLYGAELLRSKEPESGVFKVQIIKNDFIFSEMENEFNVQQMHNDSITIPEEFELLATSETCKNQFMKHKQKAIYTSQFHPEYFNHSIIENFLEQCRKQAIKRIK
ncbi:MAG: type 1 glutamine amidotransferase [Prolixibacteraceae bacterium]|nr:type 1 glutamine amidotransferase [Prolixibacteraceae bacterium]